MAQTIKIEDIFEQRIPASYGTVIVGDVDGEEHIHFRRVGLPVSGGTGEGPHTIAREFYNSYATLKEAEAVLKDASGDQGYPFSGFGGVNLKANFSKVRNAGPNLIEISASIEGGEEEGDRTILISMDEFEQPWQQALSMEKPGFFVGAIASRFAERKASGQLQDYIGEFLIDESARLPQDIYSKNFAQPTVPQFRLTKSGARTAQGNFQKFTEGRIDAGEQPEKINPSEGSGEPVKPKNGQEAPAQGEAPNVPSPNATEAEHAGV